MKEQLERDIKILREAKQISINNHDFACGVNIKALETQLMEKLQSLDTKEQREFKNKDFHVKVWQDSEKIGIETVWIREGFEYAQWRKGDALRIMRRVSTGLFPYHYPDFGLNETTDSIAKDNTKVPYSDIVTELEKADKLSREQEVTIWDVIEECKGVTDREYLKEILNKYEYINDVGQVHSQYLERILDNPIAFIYNGNQLRLKEEK